MCIEDIVVVVVRSTLSVVWDVKGERVGWGNAERAMALSFFLKLQDLN